MNSLQNSTGGGKRRRSVWARRLNILGIVLIFGALVVVSMRSFVVESFNDARHKSFMAMRGIKVLWLRPGRCLLPMPDIFILPP